MKILQQLKKEARKEFYQKLDDSSVYVDGLSWIDTIITKAYKAGAKNAVVEEKPSKFD